MFEMRGPLNECVSDICATCADTLGVRDGKQAANLELIPPAGLECGCHASKCIKISEQSAKY